MSARIKCLFRVAFASLAMVLTAVSLPAQNEPYGGDAPLGAGESVILSRESPQPREVRSKSQPYLRAVIIPMSTPDAPIRVRFQKPVNLSRMKSEPNRLGLTVEVQGNSVKGSWRWEDETELRFTPEPRTLREGSNVFVLVRGQVPLRDGPEFLPVSVSDWFTIEGFRMGPKVASESVQAGKPRFVSFLDSNLRKVGNGPFFLLYDQIVDPDSVTALLSATCAGAGLELRVRRPAALPFDQDGIYRTDHVLALTFVDLPPDGAVINLKYPTLVAGSASQFQESALTVFTNFLWSSEDFMRLKAGVAARLSSDFRLSFNSPIDPELFEEQFTITPTPPALDFSFYGDSKTVRIKAEFDVGKVYTAKLTPTFTDLIGNKLKDPLSIAFKSQDLLPLLQLPARPLLLEKGSNRLPVKYRNLKDIEVATYLFNDTASFIEALDSKGEPKPPSAEPSSVLKIQPKETTLNAIFQADFGAGLEPGLKVLEIRSQGRGSESRGGEVRRILAQTSNLGLSAKVSDGSLFAWVTRLDTAAPVAGVSLTLYGAGNVPVAKAVTAADGTATLKSSELSGSELNSTLYLAAEKDKDRSITRLANDELSGAWQFNLPGAVRGINPLSAALFTERGAYRPGETVHIKAFVRPLSEYMDYSSATCLVTDPRGQEVLNKDGALDAYRGCSWDLPIQEGAPVGEYTVSLMVGNYQCSKTFRIEEYRVPTFQVAVTSAQPSWIIDQNVSVKAAATYLKGGKLDGRPFSWRVYRQPAVVAPPAFPGYVFTLERDLSTAGTVHDEVGTLNSAGEASLSFLPSHPDSYGPMTYIVQASVTDSDRQNYAGRLTKVIHGTDMYVGVRPPPTAIFNAGGEIAFPFIVTDTEGQPIAGKSVNIYLDTLRYDQNTMLDDGGGASTYNREVVSTDMLAREVSEKAPREYSFKVKDAGKYRVRLETTDSSGRTASSAFTLTASGRNAVAWPRFDRERIDIVLDKKSYKAGETAKVVAQSPFTSARGLLTIESNGVVDSYPFIVDKDTPTVSFPIKASYAPNAYVSVVLVRGRTHYAKDATGFETGAPAYRIGYARLEVDPAAQRLSVDVEPKTLTASPGKNVKLSFKIADSAGKPSEASAAVMVVDEAVLGLTGYTTPDPVAMAYAFRVLSVRNASNLLDLPHARRARFEALFPAGDSDESALLRPTDDVLRKLFKSTAFYDAAVKVGADGTASVAFKLPDNLTTYRVMIVAANKKGQMGSGQGALLTRKSLAVEPVLPRFVYEGDAFIAEARVFNGTNADGAASLSASFTGMAPTESVGTVKLKVKGEGSATFGYRLVAGNAGGKATVRFSVAMGALSDAVEYSIPILAKGTKQITIANKIVSGPDSLTLELPKKRSAGSIEVVLSQTPLTELKDSVQYLMQYPNGCIEQTTSTAYPLVVLKDLLPVIGVEVNAADLKAFSEAGVARILSFQTKEGGLSYWPGSDKPHAFATAFGLTALIEAKKKGYNVPDTALKGMGDYLEASLASGKITDEMPHGGIADGDTKALFVMTLGRLGRPQSGYISTLWQHKDQLTPFGLSFLAIAVRESKGDQSLLDPILAEIKKAATRQKDEAYFEGSPKGGWSMDSPLRTHAGTLVAFAAADTDPKMSQEFLKGLLNRRQGGLWGNTQENVFGIMGIYQLVAGQGVGGASKTSSDLAVSINGKRYAASSFEKNSSGVLRLSVSEAALGGLTERLEVRIEGTSATSLYVTARATYEVPVDESFLAPRANGFALKRTYESMDGKSLEGQVIPLGSLVRVRLAFTNDSDRHYVAVDDKLPAGFEPLNMNLTTTESVDQGPISAIAMKSNATISYSEMRDHRVAFYADELVAGEYEYSYVARATTSGTFYRPVGRAEAMYAPNESGTTGAGTVTIK